MLAPHKPGGDGRVWSQWRGQGGGSAQGGSSQQPGAARGPRSVGCWEGVPPREILAWAFKSSPRGEMYRKQHLLVYISTCALQRTGAEFPHVLYEDSAQVTLEGLHRLQECGEVWERFINSDCPPI